MVTLPRSDVSWPKLLATLPPPAGLSTSTSRPRRLRSALSSARRNTRDPAARITCPSGALISPRFSTTGAISITRPWLVALILAPSITWMAPRASPPSSARSNCGDRLSPSRPLRMYLSAMLSVLAVKLFRFTCEPPRKAMPLVLTMMMLAFWPGAWLMAPAITLGLMSQMRLSVVKLAPCTSWLLLRSCT
jgi:hypothetical protein